MSRATRRLLDHPTIVALQGATLMERLNGEQRWILNDRLGLKSMALVITPRMGGLATTARAMVFGPSGSAHYLHVDERGSLRAEPGCLMELQMATINLQRVTADRELSHPTPLLHP